MYPRELKLNQPAMLRKIYVKQPQMQREGFLNKTIFIQADFPIPVFCILYQMRDISE